MAQSQEAKDKPTAFVKLSGEDLAHQSGIVEDIHLHLGECNAVLKTDGEAFEDEATHYYITFGSKDKNAAVEVWIGELEDLKSFLSIFDDVPRWT